MFPHSCFWRTPTLYRLQGHSSFTETLKQTTIILSFLDENTLLTGFEYTSTRIKNSILRPPNENITPQHSRLAFDSRSRFNRD